MRKWLNALLLIVLPLFFANSTFGQSGFAQGVSWKYSPAGAFPAGYATVTVCTSSGTGTPCTPTVSLFADSALSQPVANPLAACTTSPQVGCIDVFGNFSFWATPGTYTYTITGPGLSAYGPVPIIALNSTGGGSVSSLVGPGSISGVFSGSPTLSGNWTFSNPITGTASGLAAGASITPSLLNNICFVDGTIHSGVAGINTCNGLFATATPGLTWIPSNTPSTALWSTPSNGAEIIDTRFLNDSGLLEGAIVNQHSHFSLDFHAGANDAYEANNISGPVGLSINAFADAGGTSGVNAKAAVVGLFAGAIRASGSNRPIWAANFDTNYNNYGSTAQTLELGLANTGASDDTTGIGTNLLMVCNGGAGTKKCGTGILIDNSTGAGGADSWENPVIVDNYVGVGLQFQATNARVGDLEFIPPADDTALEVLGRNHANTLTPWFVQDVGTSQWAILGLVDWFTDNSGCNAAASGFGRLCNTDHLTWRDAANGSDHALGEVQHVRGVAGCTTGAGLNNTCTTLITWPSPFSDANYTAACEGKSAFTGTPVLQGEVAASRLAASITVQTINLSAIASSFGAIDCVATHD